MTSRFLGLPDPKPANLIGTVRVLPIPYDLTTSYRPGARFGPTAILEASPQIEMFDDELEWDATQHVRFLVEEEVPPNASSPQAMMDIVRQRAEALVMTGDFLLTLGGEHSLTPPVVAAHQKQYPDLHVVQIDAHGDLRDTWNDTPYSHACAMRRVVDLGLPLTQIGIRNFSEEEYHFVNAHPEIALYTWMARRLKKTKQWEKLIHHLIHDIHGPVYLTIDVDGLDPSVIPATGTPEPGGLTWYDTLEVIETLCRHHRVVGADIMELAPMPGLAYAEFATAKLGYKIISHMAYHSWYRRKGPTL